MLPSNNNDLSLLARLAHSDESALTEIYKQYWQQLFISAYNVLKDKAACEDILQNLFLSLWLRKETLQIHTSLSAYLHTAVRYQVFRHLKTGKVIIEVLDDLDTRLQLQVPSSEVDLFCKETSAQINNAVGLLPKKCKIIYKMSREQQLSHKEIAAQLGLSEKTIENQLTIALRKIRESFEDLSCLFIFIVLNSRLH